MKKQKKKSRLTNEDWAALARLLEHGPRTTADMERARDLAERGIIVTKNSSGVFELTETGAELVRAWLAKGIS